MADERSCVFVHTIPRSSGQQLRVWRYALPEPTRNSSPGSLPLSLLAVTRFGGTSMNQVFGLIFLSCFAVGCRSHHSQAPTRLSLREIASPAPPRAFSPRVIAMRDGSVLLTWLEPITDKLSALRSSFWRAGAWSAPVTIAVDQPFARHPSESPNVVPLSEKNLIAYWPQKPPSEKSPSHEVDIYFSISTDAGLHWTAPTLLNSPGTGQENSYPSAAPVDTTRAVLIWLDGRNWEQGKRVALMSRMVQADGSASETTVIDPALAVPPRW